jgi:hypothetical protein
MNGIYSHQRDTHRKSVMLVFFAFLVVMAIVMAAICFMLAAAYTPGGFSDKSESALRLLRLEWWRFMLGAAV